MIHDDPRFRLLCAAVASLAGSKLTPQQIAIRGYDIADAVLAECELHARAVYMGEFGDKARATLKARAKRKGGKR